MGNDTSSTPTSDTLLRAPDAGPSKTYDRLLEENRAYHPNPWGMSNHCSMLLASLRELGASDEVLEAWVQSQFQRRRALPPRVRELTLSNWRTALGDAGRVHDYIDFFTGELERLGSRRQLLETYLPEFLPGMAKGLFHPTIRLSFALLHASDAHVVDALAYFAGRFEVLYHETEVDIKLFVSMTTASSGKPSLQILDEDVRAFALANKGNVMVGRSNFDKLFNLCRRPEFRQVVLQHLQLDDIDAAVRDMAGTVIQLYAQGQSLFTLHAVTGFQALLDTFAFISVEQQAKALSTYFLWFSALFIHKELPPLPYQVTDEQLAALPETWEELCAPAFTLGHVHLVKMIFTCKVLFELTQLPIFKVMCVRMLQEGRPW